METFNFKRLAGEQPANLIFICTRCSRRTRYTEAQVGCSICENKFFKAARYIPLMENPIDGYRSQNSYWTDNTGGQKLNEPGNAGQMGGSGFGPDSSVGEDTMGVKDGAEGEGFGTGGNGDNLLPDDSPLREVNQKHTTSKAITSLFDRIRDERKPK